MKTARYTFPEYQRLRGVNWSTLRHMDTSGLAYRENLLNPPPPTPIMGLGSAMHAAILEPEEFEARYAVFDGRRGTKAHQEWRAEHIGVTDLKPDEWDQVMGAAGAVHRSRQGRLARRILRHSRKEVTLQWTDSDTRIRCKARPDIVGPTILADLKTTSSVDPRKFGRLAGDMVYHGKMAFAAMGLREIGHPVERVTIIAVEQKPPHDVGVFDVCPGDLERSEQHVANLLQELKTCRRRRIWPGRCENTQVLDLPPWLFESDNDISDLGMHLEVRGATV